MKYFIYYVLFHSVLWKCTRSDLLELVNAHMDLLPWVQMIPGSGITCSLLNACVIQKKRINMLFVLGGNGTHAGALAIHNEVKS